MTRGRTGWAVWGTLAVALLWFFPFHAHLNNPNENVRVYLTRAVVEHGTLSIGRREAGRDHGSVLGEWGGVNDKALVCDAPDAQPPACDGRLYAAKAPGISLLAVPAYALLSWAHRAVRGTPPSRELTVRVLRLLLVTLPWLVFLAVLGVWLRRRAGLSPVVAELTLLSLGAGSIAASYALVFSGHAAAALMLGGALLLLETRPGHAGAALGAGALLALAVATEYPTAPAATVLGVYGLWIARGRSRRWVLAGLCLGALPVASALAAYHWAAFGHPLATPYAFLENAAFVRDSAPGVHGIALPSLHSAAVGLFAPHAGLLFYMPIAALALPGAATLLRRTERPDRRALGAALLGSSLVFLVLMISMPNLRRMLGWTVGPRYIAAAGPLLSIGAAFAAERLIGRWPRAGSAGVAALVLAGVVLCGLPGLVYPHYPPSFRNPTFQLLLPLLAEGYVPHSLGTLAGVSGWLGALPGFLALAVAAGLATTAPAVRRAGLGEAPPPSAAGRAELAWRVGRAAVAVLLAGLLLGLLSLPTGSLRAAEVREVTWVRRHWEPPPAPPEQGLERVRWAAREGRRRQALRALAAEKLKVRETKATTPPRAATVHSTMGTRPPPD